MSYDLRTAFECMFPDRRGEPIPAEVARTYPDGVVKVTQLAAFVRMVPPVFKCFVCEHGTNPPPKNKRCVVCKGAVCLQCQIDFIESPRSPETVCHACRVSVREQEACDCCRRRAVLKECPLYTCMLCARCESLGVWRADGQCVYCANKPVYRPPGNVSSDSE